MVQEKQRHGCLTAWLIFMMIGNSITALLYFLNSQAIKQALPTIPDWSLPILAIIALFNLICAIALFKWQKWGFWGFLGSTVATFIINVSIGIGVGQSLPGLIGIAILYGVLNIGDNKGWSQLK